MQASEAVRIAMAHVKQFRYRPEERDFWDTLRELERDLGADCDGFAVGCIQKAWDLAETPKPTLRLVVGTISEGGHAWVELETDGDILWADPTPGWPDGLMPPSWWNRTPLFAYEYDGVIFGTQFAYQKGV